MIFREINFNSDDFRQAWELRQRVLRAPLGLRLEAHERNAEAGYLHFALFDEVDGGVKLKACVSAVPQSDTAAKIRQMAVEPDTQGSGAGRQLMLMMEQVMRARGFRELHMHARVSARGFYEKLGYTVAGAEFDEVTVPHVRMQKTI